MERLTSIIGPAPSELSHEALLARLRLERERIREALQAFRESTSPRQSRSKSPVPKGDPLDRIAASLGMTKEEMVALIKEDQSGRAATKGETL